MLLYFFYVLVLEILFRRPLTRIPHRPGRIDAISLIIIPRSVVPIKDLNNAYLSTEAHLHPVFFVVLDALMTLFRYICLEEFLFIKFKIARFLH